MFGNANSFGAAGTVKPGELTEKQKAGTVAIACQDIYYNLEDQVGKFNELSQSCAEIDKQNYQMIFRLRELFQRLEMVDDIQNQQIKEMTTISQQQSELYKQLQELQ